MRGKPATAAQIQLDVARGRYLLAKEQDATGAFSDAQERITALATTLSDTDAAALRLHPWTRHIRKAGLRKDDDA